MVQTRPPETREAALHRLAALAKERGIRVFCYDLGGAPEFYATSHTRPGTLHRTTLWSCDCPAFHRHQRCCHYAALLAEIGELPPLPEPEPTDPRGMTPRHAAHIEGQARAWLVSLIERQDAGEAVDPREVREAVDAVATYAALAGSDRQPVALAA